MKLDSIKENKTGDYLGKCCICKCMFIGEKRDPFCDDCKTVQIDLFEKIDKENKQ